MRKTKGYLVFEYICSATHNEGNAGKENAEWKIC